MCRLDLVMDATDSDDESIVGENCHLVAEKPDGPRGQSDLTTEQRNRYSNLILLCNVHHKQIDDQVDSFSVEKLVNIKVAHEQWVKTQLGFDAEREKADEVWAGYIDEWETRVDLANWRAWTSWLLGHGSPELHDEKKVALEDIRIWLFSRVWPQQNPRLMHALTNFLQVAQDLHLVFSKHAFKAGDQWRTKKLYDRDGPWDANAERAAMARFDGHVAFVQDLTLEMTRAANYVCDIVRSTLLPSYRLKDGVLLVEGGPYSDFSYKTFRVEYVAAERVDAPYPGLEEFKSARFTRDYYFGQSSDVV